jgi:HPt (histidine-containing phosphotransfer) domain-containing protein
VPADRQQLRRSLLKQFARRYHNAAVTTQIRELAHAMKSDAANLGLGRLAELSQHLESHPQADRHDWQQELTRILAEIEELQEDSPAKNAQTPQRTRELLQQLLEVLDRDLQRAFRCLDELAGADPSRLQPLTIALEDFEIDSARQQAEEWLTELCKPSPDCSS